jgi:hypothetical protein
MLHRNTARRGDYVDLLAVLDTISVPIVCGSGDVFITSNFALKSIRVQIFTASEQTAARSRELDRKYNRLRNQRTPEDFNVREIRTERRLERDPNYKPSFPNFPLDLTSVSVELADEEYALLASLRRRGAVPGEDDASVLRSAAIMGRLASVRATHDDVAFVLPDDSVSAGPVGA